MNGEPLRWPLRHIARNAGLLWYSTKRWRNETRVRFAKKRLIVYNTASSVVKPSLPMNADRTRVSPCRQFHDWCSHASSGSLYLISRTYSLPTGDWFANWYDSTSAGTAIAVFW